MDLSSTGKNQQFRGNNNSSTDRMKSSSSSSNLNKMQPNPFEVLAPFGGDLNAAIAALTAASSSNLAQLDATTLAQMNALAQFSHLAQSNPKMATAAMMSLQHQHLLGGTTSQLSQSASPQLHQPSPSLHQSLAQQQFSSPSLMSQQQSHQFLNKPNNHHTKYQQLMSVIEEMGKEIRTTYLGNKNSSEKLKRAIASARLLVKDCQMECERNSKS